MQNDRLAAYRAGQQQQQQSFEMTGIQNGAFSPPPAAGNGNGGAGVMENFYSQVTQIQDDISQFSSNVQRIQELHGRTLNAADEGTRQRDGAVLDDLVAQTRQISNSLKEKIQSLASYPVSRPQDQAVRRDQANRLRTRFVEVLQTYQNVERDYRQRYKQRIERQFRIVKPDATPEEVQAVVEDPEGGSQIFSQALSRSQEYGAARMAYRETQDRHNDIRKIENTLAELAQLFNDMSVMIAQQDEAIDQIHTVAGKVEQDTAAGDKETGIAVKHARAARRKRWICFGIFVFVIVVVALILALYFTVGPGGKK